MIRWKLEQRTGNFWTCLDQCASIATGEPAVACKVCYKRFVYPNRNINGTKAMNNHVKHCLPQLVQGQKRAAQPTLAETIGKVGV